MQLWPAQQTGVDVQPDQADGDEEPMEKNENPHEAQPWNTVDTMLLFMRSKLQLCALLGWNGALTI